MTTTTVPARPRTAIYKRISSDPLGKREGVERQDEDTRAAALRMNADVVAVFEENDRGASRYSTKPRPLYADLIRRARGGEFDVILAYSTSRLTRRPQEVEDLIDLVERHGVKITTCVSGRYDVETADGRMVARILAAADAAEVDRTSERLRRAFDQRATEGRPHGKVAYGWARVDGRDVLDPSQAAVIREAARRILARESLRSITRDLNARGIPSPRGVAWDGPILRQIMLRERNAGRRIHRGGIVGQGAWEPALDADTHDRVAALLRDPQRVSTRGTDVTYLLSGIARCGVCGGPMRSNKPQAAKSMSYVCADCQRVRRRLDYVDAVVVETVVARLSEPDGPDLLGGDAVVLAESLERADVLRTRLESAADAFASGLIDVDQLQRITASLRPQVQDAERAAEAARPADPALRGIAEADDVRAAFTGATVEVQRAIIRSLMTVVVETTTPGKSFDPSRIRITWLGSDAGTDA